MSDYKLFYLHGFNSSPQSLKAQQVLCYLKERGLEDKLVCPQVPVEPQLAVEYLVGLADEISQDHRVSFVGSSLGGYYATYLAERYDSTAVLVNPSVKPYETLLPYLGENRFYYEDGSWEFDETHIDQLKSIEVRSISDIGRYLVLLQTGDDVLDYREAVQKYHPDRCIIEQGGDHAFTGFDRYLPQIMKFSNIQFD